jgi:hypothetical protein
VTAGQLFRLKSEALPGYPALEFIGKESIMTAGEDGGRHVRPAAEREAGLEE